MSLRSIFIVCLFLSLSVSAEANRIFTVKLTWQSGSTRTDLDLTVKNPLGEEVNYARTTSNWGAQHLTDDTGSSNSTSYEAFNVDLDKMDCFASGKYQFFISHYSGPSIRATITAEQNGQTVGSWEYTTSSGDLKPTIYYMADKSKCVESFNSVILDKPQSFNWYRGCVTTAMTELFVWFKDHGSLSGNNLWNPITFDWIGCNSTTNRTVTRSGLYNPRPLSDFFANGFGFPREGCGNYGTNFEDAANQAARFLRAAGLPVNDGSSNSWQINYIPQGELEISTIKEVVDSGLPFIMAMDSTRSDLNYNPEDNEDINNHAVIVYGYKQDSNTEMTVNVMLGWHRESQEDRNTLKLFQKAVPEYALLVIPPNFSDSRRISRASATRLALESFDHNASNSLNSGVYTPPDLNDASPYLQDWIKTALNKGFVSGYPDGLYRPNKLVNRVEFLKMAINAAGISIDTSRYSQEPPFPDMDRGAWYYPYVKAAYNLGVIRGTQEGLLLPGTHLSEKEGVLIVNRLKNR